MTAAIVILSVIALFLLILLLPVSADVDYGGDFKLKVKYLGFTVYDSGRLKKSSPEETQEKKSEEKAENPVLKFFKELKAEKGFLDAVKFCFSLLKIILNKCLFIVKRVKIRKLRLDLSVATSDAAQTAIEYGAVCAAVYPPLAMLEKSGNLKAEKIDVSADFNSDKSTFSASFVAKSNLLIFVFCLIKGFIEYKQLEREWKK